MPISDDGNTVESIFEAKVEQCLTDRRIVGYFNRDLVDGDDVRDQLVEGVAFRQAIERESYRAYGGTRTELQDAEQRIRQTLENARYSGRTVATFGGIFIIALLLFIEIVFVFHFDTSLILIVSTILVGISVWYPANPNSGRRYTLRSFILAILLFLTSLCVIILPHIPKNLLQIPYVLLGAWTVAMIVGYLLRNDDTARQLSGRLLIARKRVSIFFLKVDLPRYEKIWLDDCVEEVIMPQAVLAINTILGEDKDRLLVEQDSEGLRKLQDPSFTVPTRSERRIESVLSHMDGGSIALAGPRGAGKSTLLKKFSGPLSVDMRSAPCVSVYLTAPAEYVPRDFIAELFRRLCEAYLLYVDCPLPGPIYKERQKFNPWQALRRTVAILWLLIRTGFALALIVWLTWPFVKVAYPHVYAFAQAKASHWHHYANRYAQIWWRRYRVYCRIGLLVLALFFLPGPALWKRYTRRRKEPALARKAREYLLRLQVDKTVTWGTGLNSPRLRGMSFNVNRGGSASYTPWTLPELVGYTRRFMQDISDRFKRSSQAVIVGIDEIDRIGSLEQAERFVGEIKAVFGVEKCFFLVAVAEDVGSIFAQRATAGRSILENAFDDIIMVEPLSFKETRDLLLKRVPGFTDSFVYLVHAFSGGLPRELIRITRRVVEINQESRRADHHPRLEDVAISLVKEELAEAIRASRSQLSRLTLRADWVGTFEKLRSASVSLRRKSFLEAEGLHDVITELSELSPPDEEHGDQAAFTSDEHSARRITADFSAFSFFGMTVVEAFSDRYFDFRVVQQSTARGSEGSYEELAVARTELTVSPASSRAMLYRFRESLRSHETI